MKKSEPQVGIYWVIGRRLVMFSTPAAQVQVIAGYRDYHRGHDAVWAEVKSLVPSVGAREYFQYPRGRVLWVETTGAYRILGPASVVARQKLIARIVRRFGLPPAKVHVMHDEHYDPPLSAEFDD